MDEIKCIFCETESNDVVIEENGYTGRKCPQCGLIYTSPRPSFDEIINLYGDDNAYISAESHISAGFSRRLDARHHLKIIQTFAKSGALLEIGAGAGHFLDEARKVGFSPYGLEFNPIQANYIRNKLGIPCEESPLNASIFEGRQFDVVYHCNVISHFFDPISDFGKINKLMSDNSFLIFETGNLGEVDKKYYKYFQRFQYPDHLFFFSTDNLIDLLEKTGFELVKIYRYSILPMLMTNQALSLVRKPKKRNIPKSNEKEDRLSEGSGVSINSAGDSKSFNAESLSRKIMRNAYGYFTHVFAYKIGRIAPKHHRPQTVIVVAQKRRQSDS